MSKAFARGGLVPRSCHSLDGIFPRSYYHLCLGRLSTPNILREWWNGLCEEEQESIDVYVKLLEEKGPHLPFPYTSSIRNSRHGHMRELRVQHKGDPYRVLYAFDPRRTAVLLLGGDKTGDDRWYEQAVPKADQLYEEHLDHLRKEDPTDG